MKNSYEQSLSDSTTDLDNSSSFFHERFSREAGIPRKGNHGWLSLALVAILIIIFVILALLTGLLFGHYATMVDELTVLKYNVSNSKSDTSDLWKSVDNIMGDMSKIKTQVDITGGSCSSCPPGWKLIRNYCYYFKSTSETWEKSREKCATLNGVLLIMKDINEMNALLPTIGKGRYWLGLKRSSEDTDIWVWADETPLTFSAWNEGEPNNDHDEEHCAEILGGVQAWNDRNCQHKIGYICRGVWTC
ncbi:perlucin-like protein [Rana temporaria]|uniref:perlucin-like protein n=1 Tax=Rana temporaria TaxID=8407 RepID=UPI001AAD14A3|nr:perlucin-like protein [Rana temporaria]